jgi:hypothetical protein
MFGSIRVARTDKALSAHGGLLLFSELVRALEIKNLISDCLPTLKQGVARNFRKFVQLILGFQAGADCLDDMDRLAEDGVMRAICDDKVYTPKAFGDFLRMFTGHQCKQLNLRLIDLSYGLRTLLLPAQESIVFDFDSTSNRQYGKKTEGVRVNYNGIDCLDTIQAFDELGLQYWNDVRPGNTFTSNGATEIVHNVFNRMPKTKVFKDIRRYARADSGFCNVGFFNACSAKNAGFVVCMRQKMYDPLIWQVKEWQPTNPKRDKRIKFYDGRECEIGETEYRPIGGAEVLRVVLIRAVKKGDEKLLFKGDTDYDYRVWVSNIREHEMDAERLMKFYRKRGQAENYIKEIKYGLDMKHYPCLKLMANKAYGLIAAFAYNLMRFVSLKDDINKPSYAKAIRFRHVNLPAQLVRHARQVTINFMNHHYEEVLRWRDIINNIQLWYACAGSGG